MENPAEARRHMIASQLVARGIVDEKVLRAFRAVPREEFVPPALRGVAYEDGPLPIGGGQTISQPYIVAFTAQALRLRSGDRVLEIGTGSGYEAAILAQMGGRVFSVERLAPLATAARARLTRLGFRHVLVLAGDGSLGWPEHAPYDAIAVSAGGPAVPQALLRQLAVGGRLVIPVGPRTAQMLVRVTRETETSYRREELSPVSFVPLIGEQGWSEETRVGFRART